MLKILQLQNSQRIQFGLPLDMKICIIPMHPSRTKLLIPTPLRFLLVKKWVVFDFLYERLSTFLNLHLVAWNSDGSSQRIKGKGHTTEIRFLAVDDDDMLISCSIDDTVRFTNLDTEEYGYEEETNLGWLCIILTLLLLVASLNNKNNLYLPHIYVYSCKCIH